MLWDFQHPPTDWQHKLGQLLFVASHALSVSGLRVPCQQSVSASSHTLAHHGGLFIQG